MKQPVFSKWKIQRSKSLKIATQNPHPGAITRNPSASTSRPSPSARPCVLGPGTPGPDVCDRWALATFRGHSRPRPHAPPQCPRRRRSASRRHSPSAGFPGSKPSPTPNKEPPGAGSTLPFPVMGFLSTFWGAGPRGMDPGVVSAARSLARHFRNDPLHRSILGSQEAGRPLLSTSSPPNQGQTSAPWSPSSQNECRVTPGGHGEPSPGDCLTPPPPKEARGHPGRRDLAVAGSPPGTLIRAQWGGLSWG